MAVIVSEYNSVFVHIPKTGGTSIQRWLLDNTNANVTKGLKHHSLDLLEQRYGKFDFSFTAVRNPWDWCVSWYFFRRDRALRRIKNPKTKGKFNNEYNRKILEDFEKGFDYFIKNTNLKSQSYRVQGVDYIIKLENIHKDIIPIKEKFFIESELPYLNKSTREKDYRHYYTNASKNIVAEKFNDDINKFDYEF
jgi:hypothetical protein